MKVKFYKINKKINSTFIPSGGTEIDVVLKSPSSIINPVLELRNYGDYNYCYIQEFNRYYFINNITYSNPLWIYSLNVDVLASFKTDIGNSSLYVLRSASNYDLTVKDNLYSNKEVYSVVEEEAPNSSISSFANGVYVIGVVGTNGTTGGTNYFELTPEQFTGLLQNLFVSAGGYEWGDLSQGAINSIMNPAQYITSAMWFPYSVGGFGTTTINVGPWGTTAQGKRILPNIGPTSIASFTVSKHPLASTRGEYLNDRPFTKYTLDSGYLGMVDIPNELLFNKTILYLGRRTDFATGLANFEIRATDSGGNDIKLASIDSQVGVSIPLTSDSTGMASLLMGGISLAGGLLMGNPLLVGEGVEDIIGGGLTNLSPSISTKGNRGSIVSANIPIKFRSVFYNVVDDDLVNKGRPLCQMKTLNTLTGFIQCETGDIISNATDGEKESISNFLTSGFYYE